MEILRASIAHLADARVLIEEYYEAVGVVKRDAPEEVIAFLTEARSGVWLAYEAGEAAGCVVLRPLPSIALAAECKRLYVRSRFRGRRVADLLLDGLEAFAAGAGWEWIYLDSKDDLREAVRIYARRGYQECGRYNDNPQATLFLRKRLDGPAADAARWRAKAAALSSGMSEPDQ